MSAPRGTAPALEADETDSRIYIEHPMQPVAWDGEGVVRFKANPIVRVLLDVGPFDLNMLAKMRFQDHDRDQLAQLIGYSVSRYSKLPYVTDARNDAAQELRYEVLSKMPWDPMGAPR